MNRNNIIPLEKMNKEYLDSLYTLENPTPYEVITMKCFDCCAYEPIQSNKFFLESKQYVMECSSKCPLRDYLHGKDFGKKATKLPKRKSNMSEENRKAAKERLMLGRQNKRSKQ